MWCQQGVHVVWTRYEQGRVCTGSERKTRGLESELASAIDTLRGKLRGPVWGERERGVRGVCAGCEGGGTRQIRVRHGSGLEQLGLKTKTARPALE